jgi:ribosomal protein S17E
MSVRVDVKRTPGRLSFLARGKTAESGVGEVYLNGAANLAHAAALTARGHDPMDVPDEVKRMAREFVKVGARSFDPQTQKRTLTAAAQYVARWLRNRIATGQLGMMKPATIKIKTWLIDHGRASSQFGRPGPYGFSTGHLYRNILARWRPGRGSR